MEGAGSYGAGLARFLSSHGHTVIEVNRPDRSTRRRLGKSDPIDAESAARSVLAGTAVGTPKSGTGSVEMIRMLKIARDSAIKARSQAMSQMMSLLVTLPAQLRETLDSLPVSKLSRRCAGFRPGEVSTITSATEFTLRSIARRHRQLSAEISALDSELARLLEATPTAVVTATVEAAGSRIIVINRQGDVILYNEGWALDGPDQANTISLSTGTPSDFGMVTVRSIELPSPDTSLDQFAEMARGDLLESLPLRRDYYSASLIGDGASSFWSTEFDVDLPTASVSGVERDLVHDGVGYSVQGVWTANSDPSLSEQVKNTVRSFTPAVCDPENIQVGLKRTIEYEQAGAQMGSTHKYSLGHYVALEDSSLWEIALADRLVAMTIGANEQFRVEKQDAGSPFPYVLAHAPGTAMLSAFFVGKGEGVLP